MTMCIGSENWNTLSEPLKQRIVMLVRHTDEGMTTMRDQKTLLDVLALWLDFCDPADVGEFLESLPEYDEPEPESIGFVCQD